MTKMEKRRIVDGRKIRFTNFIDPEGFKFESETEGFMPNAAIEQRLGSLGNSSRDFYIMQMRGKDGAAVMQACIHVGRPRGFSGFSMATAPKLGRARDLMEEEIALRALREFFQEIPSIMTLRLQAERFDSRSLMEFEMQGLRQGYKVSDPIGTVRTRIVDLCDSEDEFNERLPAKTRASIFRRGREKVELRVLTDKSYIGVCRAAETASRLRSGGAESSYDFDAIFSLAASEPSRVRIVGVFLKNRPTELLAYSIGFRRGNLLEYSSGGSFFDKELRTVSFNYYMLWDLMCWGRSQGCAQMDLGGVTDGTAEDPLRGITSFKRAFPGKEIEIGREMVALLNPSRFFIYRVLKSVKEIRKFAVACD